MAVPPAVSGTSRMEKILHFNINFQAKCDKIGIMHMKNLSIFAAFLLLTSPAWARPPSKITAQYDQSKGVLMLDIYHLSRDNLNEYIKRVEVRKNGAEPVVKRPRQQINPNVQYVDVSLKADEGDVLTITAVSSLGGELTQELEITEELLTADIEPRRAPRRAVSTHPSDKSKLKAAVPRGDSDTVKPAVPRDPDKYSSAHPTDSSKLRPAVPRGSDVMKPAVNPEASTSAHPKDKSKYKPANAGYNR